MDVGLLICQGTIDTRLSESLYWLGTDSHPIGSLGFRRSLRGLELKLPDPGIFVHVYPYPREQMCPYSLLLPDRVQLLWPRAYVFILTGIEVLLSEKHVSAFGYDW